MIPRSTSVSSEGEPPADGPPPQRLQFDPYDGPKSFHASRAFAEMQERAARRARVKKTRVAVAVALTAGLLVLLAAGMLLSSWLRG